MNAFPQTLELLNGRPYNNSVAADQLLQVAQQHRLTGYLYPLFQDVPVEVVKLFKSAYVRQQHWALQRMQMLFEIHQLLQQAQIPCIHLKGILLSLRLWNDPARRLSSDIDILVAPVHLPQVDELLRAHGFVPLQAFKPYLLHHTHHLVYDHHTRKQRVEVHFTLYSPHLPSPSFHTLWQNRQEIPWENRSFACLDPHTEWHFLYTHAAEDGWRYLSWIYELGHFQKKWPMPHDKYALFWELHHHFFPHDAPRSSWVTKQISCMISRRLERAAPPQSHLREWYIYRLWLCYEQGILRFLKMRTYQSWYETWQRKRLPMWSFPLAYMLYFLSLIRLLPRRDPFR